MPLALFLVSLGGPGGGHTPKSTPNQPTKYKNLKGLAAEAEPGTVAGTCVSNWICLHRPLGPGSAPFREVSRCARLVDRIFYRQMPALLGVVSFPLYAPHFYQPQPGLGQLVLRGCLGGGNGGRRLKGSHQAARQKDFWTT